VLALLAGQRDLRPYVGGSHDGVPFWARDMDMRRALGIRCAPCRLHPLAKRRTGGSRS
jgi:hypothetical protein